MLSAQKMVDHEHKLPTSRQLRGLDLSRSSLYYELCSVSEMYLQLMRERGVEAVHRKSRTTKPSIDRKIYAHLPCGITVY